MEEDGEEGVGEEEEKEEEGQEEPKSFLANF